eukprot:6450113-Pyramimonas_sp.AAC.1
MRSSRHARSGQGLGKRHCVYIITTWRNTCSPFYPYPPCPPPHPLEALILFSDLPPRALGEPK